MNEGETKVEGLEKTAEILQTNPEQSIGEVVSGANSQMENALKNAQSKIAGVENNVGNKKTLEEKRNALKGVKITDADIVEKLAGILGANKEDFNAEELQALVSYAKEREGHWEDSLGWKEWVISKTGDTLFINGDGSMGVKES